ncbi:hypothetical protein PTKIN_Ptkin16aG0504500 [Pterospermum kingtungense]
MTSSLDMSLDDIIRNKRRTEGHVRDSRREPRVSGSGPDCRASARGPIRTNPYPVRPQMQVPAARQGELVQSGGSDMEGKLHISNLDSAVSNEDIKVIFSEVGDLKRYSINYNENGISKGTAEVVFFRQADAMAAIKRYNNVELDGKSLIIELVGANVVMSAPVPPPKTSTQGKPNMASKSSLILQFKLRRFSLPLSGTNKRLVEGHMYAVVVVAVMDLMQPAVGLLGDVEEVDRLVKNCLQKILMLNWISTT